MDGGVKYCGGRNFECWYHDLNIYRVKHGYWWKNRCRDRGSSKTGQSYIVDVEVALLNLMVFVELTSCPACSDVTLAVLMKTPCTKWRIRRSRSMRVTWRVFHNNWECRADFHMHKCHYFSSFSTIHSTSADHWTCVVKFLFDKKWASIYRNVC